MKLIHENPKSKKSQSDVELRLKSYDDIVEGNPDLAPHISKAVDDLTPLRVQALFGTITAEVRLVFALARGLSP
jgi:DNA-directed RNA polymerase III subunit RPC1